MNKRKQAQLVRILKQRLFHESAAIDTREFRPLVEYGGKIHHTDERDGSIRLLFEGAQVMVTVKFTVEQVE